MRYRNIKVYKFDYIFIEIGERERVGLNIRKKRKKEEVKK